MKTILLSLLACLGLCSPLLFAQDTNSLASAIPETVSKGDIFGAMFSQVANSPASLLVIVGLAIIAWLVHQSKVSDSKIPWICCVAGGATYWLFSATDSVPKNFPYPHAVLVVNGLVCGFLAFIAHFTLLKIVKHRSGVSVLLVIASLSLGALSLTGCRNTSAQQAAYYTTEAIGVTVDAAVSSYNDYWIAKAQEKLGFGVPAQAALAWVREQKDYQEFVKLYSRYQLDYQAWCSVNALLASGTNTASVVGSPDYRDNAVKAAASLTGFIARFLPQTKTVK